MLIVLASATVAKYPLGGGHWNWRLQYPLGLADLGHDVVWLETLEATADRASDLSLINNFLERTAHHGFAGRAIVALAPKTPLGDLATAEVFGATRERVAQVIRDADLVWNFWYGLTGPLLNQFRRSAFIDVDPGHLQVCAATFPDLAIDTHDTYLTVGLKMHDADCGVPTLGRKWHPFRPFVHLPLYNCMAPSDKRAPFSSITHWTWEELHFNHRVFSVSKRAAYMRYADLPRRSGQTIELVADLPADDATMLLAKGWQLARPDEVTRTPEQYREYIERSRAEFLCPKPIHLDLKSGWFSDRSSAYLATGRPVLAEDTGFSEKVPTGVGLVPFTNLDEAAAGVTEIGRNYTRHSRAARELAEAYFDSRKCLSEMLAACEA